MSSIPDGVDRAGTRDVAALSFAILAVVIHLAAAWFAQFGIFRDELYYIACANHPATGYVDHPPLSIWALGAWKAVFGDSLFSIRVLPSLCAGTTTFIAGTLARGFGGGRYAVFLACAAATFAPIFLAFSGFYSMNAFDLTLWAAAFLLLQRIIRAASGPDWILLGLVMGLGALNKISMLWLGAGLFLALLATPHRTILRTAAPRAAGLIALLVFLPYAAWNIAHDFAHLEFIRTASSQKYASQNPLTFFPALPLMIGPAAFPLLIAGFWFLLARNGFRLIGLTALGVLAILLLNVHSKAEYFAAAMTGLIPAGAVQAERWLAAGWGRPVRVVYGRNYGEATAVDYYGRGYGLPPAISRHNSYWYWSVGQLRQDAIMIVIGVPPDELRHDSESVTEAGMARAAHVMPYENNLVITVCRGLCRPVMEMWDEGRFYI